MGLLEQLMGLGRGYSVGWECDLLTRAAVCRVMACRAAARCGWAL